MVRFMAFLISAFVLVLGGFAPPALARSFEDHYCHSLIDRYAAVRDADTAMLDTATAKCDAGDTRDGIALLEQALKDAQPGTQARK